MKKTKFLLAGIIAFFLYSCSDELDIPLPSEPISKDVFGISEAKRYFEDNANDLSFMHFEDHAPSTRSAKQQHLELTPDWSKAVRTTNHQASVIEVPILLNAMIISSVNQFEKGEKMRSKHYLSSVRLVIAQDKEGKTDMFVTTLLPSLKYRNQEKEMENFRYLGGSNFTGKVFASTLDGRFVEASQYVNGQFVGLLNVTTRKKLEENNIDIKNDDFYESINFIPAVASRSGTYGFDENGGGSTGGGGGGGGSTGGGGSIGGGGSTGGGYCQYHTQYPASDCPYCLPEVVVRYCQTCGARLEKGETCNCRCLNCGYYPCRCCRYCDTYPCTCKSTCDTCRPYTCQKCTKCGRHFCFESCGNPKDDGNITPPPDRPKPTKCPKCNQLLENCTCTEKCPKCKQALEQCKCPKKVDCTIQAIKNSAASSYNWAKFLDAGLKTAFLDTCRNASIEYGTSLENINGVYSIRKIYTNHSAKSVDLQYGQYTEAAVHNHPSGNPPSLKDVFKLAKMNETSNGKYESSFVVPKTGPIYVLHVTDMGKATIFYHAYKDKKLELEAQIREIFDWLVSNGGGDFPEEEFYGYTLARILQKYDSGISLLQLEGEIGAFKQMEATVERQNGQITNIIYTICK